MAKRSVAWVAGLCWFLGATSSADPTARHPDEQQIIDEFSAMAAMAAPLGIAFKTAVVDDVRDGDSPIAMGYDAGTCTLVVQVRNNSLYRTLVMANDGHAKSLKLRAILAHEMGHCFRHYFGATQTNPATAVGERALRHALRESEVQADRFALAWTAIYEPSEYDDVLQYLQTMRAHLWADRSGRYARARELDADTRTLDEPGKSVTERLVEIATVHQASRSPPPAPLR